MVITRIERQKNRQQRVNIYCDNEVVLGIDQDVLMKFRLRTGDTLSDEQLKQLQTAEELHLAKEKALRFIRYRVRSEKEVRTKLREHEFPPPVIEETTSALKTMGVLNDQTFAEAFVHDQLMKKPAGEALIRRKLQLHGISKNIIDEVVKAHLGGDTQIQLARDAALKHMKRYRIARKQHDRLKQRKRLADFLARRGFSWQAISSVVKEFFPQSEE